MPNKKKEQSLKIKALDIAILLSCLLLAWLCILTAGEFVLMSPYRMDADSYRYRLEDGDYVRMLDSYRSYDAEPAKNKQEYYAVAEYFEAATFYHAYAAAGDTEKAEKYQKRMTQAAGEMGSLSPVREKIDARFDK